MNRRIANFLLPLLMMCFFCTFCNSSNSDGQEINILQDIPVEEKNPVKYITKTPDGVEFKRPLFIGYNKYDNNLYIADSENHRIVILDVDLNYITQFGTKGKGPGEFDEPSGVAFTSKGDFVITDFNNRRIHIFGKDYKYISHFKINLRLASFYYVRTDSNDRIFANLPNRDSLFTVLNFDGDELEKFGEIFDYKYKNWLPEHNVAYYDFDKDYNLYCAFMNHAVFRKYDKDFNLVYEKDYSLLPPVQDQLKRWEKKIEERGGIEKYNGYLFKVFITCFSVDEKSLYINNSLDKYIYVFDKDNGTLTKKLFLHAPDIYGGVNIGHLFFDCSSQDYIYIIGSALVAKFKK
ncbi:hypothetical protein AMJ80_06810 [bacterium SM23_31]|nr:MAG: hypothetical protein AMJ80_06810 [bacterium SM23_31]